MTTSEQSSTTSSDDHELTSLPANMTPSEHPSKNSHATRDIIIIIGDYTDGGNLSLFSIAELAGIVASGVVLLCIALVLVIIIAMTTTK